MVSCASCGTTRSEKTKRQGVTFHDFPRKPVRRQTWIDFLGNTNWQYAKYSYLCSLHFTEECFYRVASGRTRLHTGAIPTIKIQRPRNRRDQTDSPIIMPNVPIDSMPSIPASTASVVVSQNSFQNRPLLQDTNTHKSPAYIPKPEDTKKLNLETKLREMVDLNTEYEEKERHLQKIISRQKARIHSLNAAITELKNGIIQKEENNEAILGV